MATNQGEASSSENESIHVTVLAAPVLLLGPDPHEKPRGEQGLPDRTVQNTAARSDLLQSLGKNGSALCTSPRRVAAQQRESRGCWPWDAQVTAVSCRGCMCLVK